MKKLVMVVMVALSLCALAADLYVDCSASRDGDGSKNAPFKTLQVAVDAARAGDTVWVAPGDYDVGKVKDFSKGSSRVQIVRPIRLVSTGGASATRIVGRHGAEKNGLGKDAIRCVAVKSSARGAEIVGFTLADGAGAHSNGSNGFSGGLLSEGGRTDVVRMVDCVITNCVGTRGAGAFGGSALRTTFIGNRSFNDLGNCGGAAVRYTDLVECRIENCSGLYVIDYPGKIEHCEFMGNRGESLLLQGVIGTNVVKDCKFVGNYGGKGDRAIRFVNCEFIPPKDIVDTPAWRFADDVQRRIDMASAAGGGVVKVPQGHWVSEGIQLKSNVTLDVPEGCYIEATTNRLFWGNSRAFIWADGATNVALVGKGTIDVHGELYPFYDEAPGRISVAVFSDVQGLRIHDVTLKRSAAWTLVLGRCVDVHVKGVKIRSTVNFNNDGIDIEARRCLIEDCDIDSDDDAICFKPNTRDFPVEDVEVRNCLVSSSCNFIKFGTGSLAPVRRINIHDCKIFARTHSYVRDYKRWRSRLPGGIGDFANGIAAIALEVVDGGSMEDITVRNLDISGCWTPIFIRHAARKRFCDPWRYDSFLRNILIENVRGSCVSRIASSITGVPGKRVQNVTLRNIDLTYPGGATEGMLAKPVPEREDCYPEASCFGHVLPGWAFYVRHADNIRFENVKVRLASPDARKFALVTDDASGVERIDCNFGNDPDRSRNVVVTSQEVISRAPNASGHQVSDFGKDAFGWLEINSATGGVYELMIGELRDEYGIVTNRYKGSTIRTAKVRGNARAGTYRVPLIANKRNTTGPKGSPAILLPEEFGVVMPFRYVEEIALPSGARLVRKMLHYPMDMAQSSFESDSEDLNRVYEFCKYSILATSFMGIYVDGDRERIPYEGDAYINQLGHYAIESDYALARKSHEYLMRIPTWPTEWRQHSIKIAWADWMFSGDTRSLERNYDKLVGQKLLGTFRRRDIVDWPIAERDGFVMTNDNSVVDAFDYRNRLEMADIAEAIGRKSEADGFRKQAEDRKRTFLAKYLRRDGLIRDTVVSEHSSIHANAAAMAFGLVPDEYVSAVIAHMDSRGMAASVYFAQYILEAYCLAGRADLALKYMTARGERSWLGMLDFGSTITMEAWNMRTKPNQDLNHAWGAVPLNVISRFILGVTPLEPGFAKIGIAPQLGGLKRIKAKVPTAKGPVELDIDGGRFTLFTPAPSDVKWGGKTYAVSAGTHVFTMH